MEPKFIIEAGLAQAVLNYLVTRPYAEVHQLINRLIVLEELKPPAPPVLSPTPVVD